MSLRVDHINQEKKKDLSVFSLQEEKEEKKMETDVFVYELFFQTFSCIHGVCASDLVIFL